MKVWLVTSGSYSDYGVDCVATTEKLAMALVAAGVGEEYEECVMLDVMPEGVTVLTLTAAVDVDGNVLEETSDERTAFPVIESLDAVEWTFYPAHEGLTGWPGRLIVSGTDLEKVAKVYGELKFRAQADPVWRSRFQFSGRSK